MLNDVNAAPAQKAVAQVALDTTQAATAQLIETAGDKAAADAVNMAALTHELARADAAQAVLNDANATTAQKAVAQGALDTANTTSKVLIEAAAHKADADAIAATTLVLVKPRLFIPVLTSGQLINKFQIKSLR